MDDTEARVVLSQIEHIRGFQTAQSDQIRALTERIEALQERQSLGECDTLGCPNIAQIEVKGTMEADALEGLPGPLVLRIHSSLCSACWRVFALSQGDSPAVAPSVREASPKRSPTPPPALGWGIPPGRNR